MKSILILFWSAFCTVISFAQLTIRPGTVMHVHGNAAIALKNTDLQNAGTFLPGSGTVAFLGSANQTSTGATFHHLTVDKSNAPTDMLTLAGDVTVNGTLNMTNGRIATGSNQLTLGSSATVVGEASGNYVMGTLQSSRTVNNSTVNFGDMGVVIDATGETLGAVTVTRKTGISTVGNSYIQNGSGDKSIDRIWTVSPANQPSSGVNVTLTWLSENDNGITDFSAAQIWKSNDGGTTWQAVGPMQNASGRSIAATFSGFSSITVGGTGASFPVEWLSFEATPTDDAVRLDWTTGSEQNNAFFAVERSEDGRAFAEISEVAAAGNSATPTAYAFTDSQLPATTTLYYRIRQVDMDGSASHSEVRTVTLDPTSGLMAWPNPATDRLWVRVPADHHSLVLCDVAGRMVMNQSLDGQATALTLDLSTLAAGVYVLRTGAAAIRVVKE